MHYLLQILSILTNIQKDIIILLTFFFFRPFYKEPIIPEYSLRRNGASSAQASIPQYQSWGDTPQPKRIKGPKAGPLCPTKCGPGRKHGPLRILATQLRASPSSLFTFISSCASRYVWSCSFSAKLPLHIIFYYNFCYLLTTKKYSSLCVFPATTKFPISHFYHYMQFINIIFSNIINFSNITTPTLTFTKIITI